MPIRVYHNPLSPAARRVRIAALELGTANEIEWKLVDFTKGEHKHPTYLAMNPNGKVPMLEHDGFHLWESNAMMAYIAEHKPGNALYPTDTKARADVNRWLFWEATHFGEAVTTLVGERVLKPLLSKQPPDPTIVADAEASFHRFAAILNGHLETRSFVTGKMSIADFALAAALTYRTHATIDITPYKHLGAWLARIEERESWKQTKPPM